MARHREDTPGYKEVGSTGALVGIGSEDYAARCLRSQTQPGRGTDDIELLCGEGGKMQEWYFGRSCNLAAW